LRILFILLLCSFMAGAALPSFREPVLVQANGSDIDVGVISEPFMVDWDRDGLTDLLVGQFSPGKVSFFQNIGSNQNPEFVFSGYLQADGSDISVSAG